MCIYNATIVVAPSVGISTINGPAVAVNNPGDVVNTNGDQVFVTNSRFRI